MTGSSLKDLLKPYWLSISLVALSVFFVISSLRFFEKMPVASWGDTNTYHAMSRYALTDPNLWAGRYPMTTALFHKICSAQPDCIANLQIWLGSAAWIIGGLVIILLIENRILKLMAFAVILGLALTPNIIGMNKILLSETYGNSLFLLTLAAWILAGRFLSKRPELAPWQQIGVILSFFP
ncbi:MAG TPA: hypothetical protein VJZ27_17855, partial [Aggregatilineales bacterium]|nr:hypothetical protein [Aggregatilineales bacterium]